MHIANQPVKPRPASLDDVIQKLGELQELATAAAEAAKPRLIRSRMSVRQKVALISEYGQAAYLKLPFDE